LRLEAVVAGGRTRRIEVQVARRLPLVVMALQPPAVHLLVGSARLRDFQRRLAPRGFRPNGGGQLFSQSPPLGASRDHAWSSRFVYFHLGELRRLGHRAVAREANVATPKFA